MGKGDAIVSNHAKKRMKERAGLNKKAADRHSDKVLDYGLSHSETRGNLKKYIDGLYLKYGKMQKVRVYGHYIYFYSYDNVLITVFKLPNDLCKIADKQQKQKRQAIEEQKKCLETTGI